MRCWRSERLRKPWMRIAATEDLEQRLIFIVEEVETAIPMFALFD